MSTWDWEHGAVGSGAEVVRTPRSWAGHSVPLVHRIHLSAGTAPSLGGSTRAFLGKLYQDPERCPATQVPNATSVFILLRYLPGW